MSCNRCGRKLWPVLDIIAVLVWKGYGEATEILNHFSLSLLKNAGNLLGLPFDSPCVFTLNMTIAIYCILASCYIRFTLNVCSFVHQCNTFTFYFLLIVDMFWPHTAIFRSYSILSRSWCSVMPIFTYVMLPAMCFC
jgi:hypothetical protein